MSTSAHTSTKPIAPLSHPAPKPHQGMTKQTIDAEFAEQAYNRGIYESERARNNVVSKKLIVLFMEKFKMDARQAKAAVEREMGQTYAANPWDASPPRETMRQQRAREEQRERVVSSHGKPSTDYGKEQWDLFEKTFS